MSMVQLIKSILRFRVLLSLLIVVVTMAWLVPLSKMGVEMDNRPERFAPADDPAFDDLEAMSKVFGRDDYFVVLLKGDVWTPEFFAQNEQLHSALSQMSPKPEQIWSLYNAPLYRDDGSKRNLVRVGKKNEEASKYKNGAKHLVERLISKNGEWSAIWCQAPSMSQKESAAYFHRIEEIAQNNVSSDLSVLVGGFPAFSAALDDLTMEESNRLGGLAFGLMIVFLALWFRRVSMVIGPVLVMLLGIVWTYGAMSVFGVSLSYMTSVLPGFLISVCVGDAMHIQALIHQNLQKGASKTSAIQSAFLHSFRPILWTSLTTAGGLLSFRMASLPAVVEMGTFGAIGVGMACVLSLLLVPICVSYVFEKETLVPSEQEKTNELGWFLSTSYRLSKGRNSTKILLAFFVLIGLGAWGTTKVKAEHEPLSWIPKENPTRMAMDILDEGFGGAAELTIWVQSTDKQGVLSTRHLKDMYEIKQKVLAYGDVNQDMNITPGVGVLETLELLHEAATPQEPFSELMKNDGALTRMVMNLSLARPDWASDVVSSDQRSAKFVFRLPWLAAHEYIPLREYLHNELKPFSERGLEAKPLGVLFTLLATFGALVQELMVSFGVAAVFVGLLMILFLRSVKLGLISMVPNFVPVILTLGGMGFLGIPLDLGTVLFASIVLGICVDDTIHLLHHFKEEYQEHGDVDKAIHQALLYAGKAIFVTSLLLICCMGIYLFSDLLSLQRFGGLMLMSVVWAILADLFLTPIILRKLYS